MMNMELRHADNLNPDQLMVNDLIQVNDDIVEVKLITSDSTGDNYFLELQNEYGEIEIATFSYTDLIPLFVFIDTSE